MKRPKLSLNIVLLVVGLLAILYIHYNYAGSPVDVIGRAKVILDKLNFN